jgi:hypothetical protein
VIYTNPNLFKLQENPDGLEGHIERGHIRNEIDAKDKFVKPEINVESEDQLPGWLIPVTSPKEQKELRRHNEIERRRKSCEFFGVGCNKADCIKCRSKGVPKHKIKNLIQWM